ncbi:hypothetical protein BKA70DRAFT_1528030 [Coprinopsis sp. MPI-PUGE-AT-0042]|nr:hypothetical protein BKA70DRAFT_1528030 [Coprinopsis sp. MPI-PUGE-AT-0042]
MKLKVLASSFLASIAAVRAAPIEHPAGSAVAANTPQDVAAPIPDVAARGLFSNGHVPKLPWRTKSARSKRQDDLPPRLGSPLNSSGDLAIAEAPDALTGGVISDAASVVSDAASVVSDAGSIVSNAFSSVIQVGKYAGSVTEFLGTAGKGASGAVTNFFKDIGVGASKAVGTVVGAKVSRDI